ncbi:hypothetical protein BX600DRAFT_461821 [Xylariales sp. PMI_506]|nr:hypothetical protein BX600DRAFT_461821 [Xylariales sp. PMI_506]
MFVIDKTYLCVRRELLRNLNAVPGSLLVKGCDRSAQSYRYILTDHPFEFVLCTASHVATI